MLSSYAAVCRVVWWDSFRRNPHGFWCCRALRLPVSYLGSKRQVHFFVKNIFMRNRRLSTFFSPRFCFLVSRPHFRSAAMRGITHCKYESSCLRLGRNKTASAKNRSKGMLESNTSLRTQTTPCPVLRRVSTLVVFACHSSCATTPAVILSGLPRYACHKRKKVTTVSCTVKTDITEVPCI